MFRTADLVLVTKIDLLPHLAGIRIEEIAANLARVMPRLAWLPVSAVSGDGIEAWQRWLAGLGDSVRTPVAASSRSRDPDHHRHD